MDKFNQSIEKTKKCIDPSVLTEADGTNIFDQFSQLFIPLKYKQNRIAGKSAIEFDADNIYYLVGGAKSLTALKQLYQADIRSATTRKEVKTLKSVKMFLRDIINDFNTRYSTAKKNNTPDQANLQSALQALYDENERLDTEIAEILTPFKTNGTLKTDGKLPPTVENINNSAGVFRYGLTILPALLYKALYRSSKKYVTINDLIDEEIRSRAEYAVKIDVTEEDVDLEEAHNTIMNYVTAMNKINKSPAKIIYITEDDAVKFDKEKKMGSLGKQLTDMALNKASSGIKSDFKTYTGGGKGPTMTL